MLKMRVFAAKPLLPSLVLVFCGSIVVSLCFWSLLPGRFRLSTAEQSDYHSFYEPVARNILAGRGISLQDGSPATLFPPGYPMMLSLFFAIAQKLSIPEATVLLTFSVFTMALISSLIFLISRLLLSASASLVASAIWMTYPFALWLTGQPNSEGPFMLFLYGSLTLFWYALIRRPRAWILFFLCGLGLGAAMLIRPIAIGIVPVMCLIVVIVKRELPTRFRTLLVMMLLVGNLLTVVPWETWIFSKSGKVIPLSTSGPGNVAEGLIFAVNQKRYHGQIYSQDILSTMNELRPRLLERGDSFSAIARALFMEFKSRPFATIKLLTLKIARSWYGTDSGRHETTILVINLVYLLGVAFAVVRAWRSGGMFRNFAIGSLLIVMYFWGMTVLAISIVRYMVPVMGLLFILLAGAVIAPGIPKYAHDHA